MSVSDKIKQNISNKMILQLEADLTDGMKDNGLVPYTPEQIQAYLKDHASAILDASKAMYDTYEGDGDLEELGDGSQGELDWYREFLYDYVKPPNLEQMDN